MPVARSLSARTVRAGSVGVLAAAAALGLAACSNTQPAANKAPHTGSATASTVNGVQQVTIHASDFRFSPSTITVHPGKVKVILVNDGGGAPHNFQVPKFPSDWVPLTANGDTKESTFTAPAPGRYQFVCTIHTQQGMTGTLVVLPS
ncbi:MAG TPA: cupredoxin domain-containing protein [Jatrophihabitantaceae bacterium]|jgi:plastocyanin|nr:cupredoxin domain-containing protein [Jatrophihabitantaceae bacterium]